MTAHIEHEQQISLLENQLENDLHRYDAELARQQAWLERGGIVGKVLGSLHGLRAHVFGAYLEDTIGSIEADELQSIIKTI